MWQCSHCADFWLFICHFCTSASFSRGRWGLVNPDVVPKPRPFTFKLRHSKNGRWKQWWWRQSEPRSACASNDGCQGDITIMVNHGSCRAPPRHPHNRASQAAQKDWWGLVTPWYGATCWGGDPNGKIKNHQEAPPTSRHAWRKNERAHSSFRQASASFWGFPLTYASLYLYKYMYMYIYIYLCVCLSVCLSVCLPACPHVCMCVYMHMHMCMCTYVLTSVCLCVYLCVRLQVRTSVPLHVCITRMRMYTHVCVSIRIYAYVCVCMCVCVYVCV